MTRTNDADNLTGRDKNRFGPKHPQVETHTGMSHNPKGPEGQTVTGQSRTESAKDLNDVATDPLANAAPKLAVNSPPPVHPGMVRSTDDVHDKDFFGIDHRSTPAQYEADRASGLSNKVLTEGVQRTKGK